MQTVPQKLLGGDGEQLSSAIDFVSIPNELEARLDAEDPQVSAKLRAREAHKPDTFAAPRAQCGPPSSTWAPRGTSARSRRCLLLVEPTLNYLLHASAHALDRSSVAQGAGRGRAEAGEERVPGPA